MNKIESITSKENPRIKEAVKLRQRKERDSQKLFIVEGCRELSLALSSSVILKEVFYCPELLDKKEAYLIDQSAKKGAKITEVNKNVFLKISYGERQEGVLALAEQKPLKLNAVSLSKNPLIIAVESLEKPGNLGAVLRSCDAAGVELLIVCDSKTDIFNPNCIRASLGAFFSVPVIEETSQNTIAWLKKNNLKIFLAMPDAETEYTKADFSRPSAVVLGSEHKGLAGQWLEAPALKIKIPMKGKSNSLNVAQAATILIYEAIRQRKSD